MSKVERFSVSKDMFTETAHRLVGYTGKCQHLHGHSYKWTVKVSGESLDEVGMLVDFKDLKKAMHEIIGKYDHALVLCDIDPLYTQYGSEVFNILRSPMGFPPRLFLYPWNPTAENFARHVWGKLFNYFEGRYEVQVIVRETETSYAQFP